MPSASTLKRLVNGSALVKHIFGVLGVLGIVIIAGTLLYADVKATGKKVDENRVRVEAIESKINKVVTQQQLLLQGTTNEKELNKDFRKETARALSEILLRLPRQERPMR